MPGPAHECPGVATREQAATAPRPISFGTLYEGWLTVQKSDRPAMDEYVTERMLSFSGGWVETRQIRWSRPLESVCATTKRCYMLNLSLSGKVTGGTVTNLHGSGESAAAPIGGMWLVPPGHTLRLNSMAGDSRSIRCALDADLFERLMGGAPRRRWGADLFRSTFNLGSGEIEWLLRRMNRELANPDFATRFVIEALAQQLAIEIIRTLELRGDEPDFYAGGLTPWRLRLIRERLWSEGRLPDLAELAERCGLTVRHLSRAFRAETGRTVGDQIESVMVVRASRMLGDGMRVAAVADALGYANSGTFATAFRRATGLLPSEVTKAGAAHAKGRGDPATRDDQRRGPPADRTEGHLPHLDRRRPPPRRGRRSS